MPAATAAQKEDPVDIDGALAGYGIQRIQDVLLGKRRGAGLRRPGIHSQIRPSEFRQHEAPPALSAPGEHAVYLVEPIATPGVKAHDQRYGRVGFRQVDQIGLLLPVCGRFEYVLDHLGSHPVRCLRVSCTLQ